ncbi:SseB family protein [Dermabacteraceae bacterium P13136]
MFAKDSAAARTLPQHFREKSPLHDTAGVPWEGRGYTSNPFAGDDGTADANLLRALQAAAAGQDAHLCGVLAALPGKRVLVPIVAVATDTEVGAHGHHADNASDMAMVKLQNSRGEAALPVFTSVAALSAWNSEARPVPMLIEKAAQSAVAEECVRLVVDLGSEHTAVLQRAQLWALAQGRDWLPPWDDAEVIAEAERIAELVTHIERVRLRPGASSEVDFVLHITPGLDRERLAQSVRAAGDFVSRSQLIAERVSSIKFAVTNA